MYVFFDKRFKIVEKCNAIWKKVSNITKKEFDIENEIVHNEKYLKTKINFLNKKNQHRFSQKKQNK